MKKLTPAFRAGIIILFLSILHSCSKSSGSDCWTCRAYGNGGSVTTREVCTEMEEQNFRNEMAGTEISCN